MPTNEKRRIARLALVLAVLLMACSAFFFISPKPVKADAGDNYPWKDAMLVPGTPGSVNALALWGYTTCPATTDSGCMAGKIVGSDKQTYGYADRWGYALHYCTSWVAWALHDRNGFEMPYAIGDASAWKQWASDHNYTVDQKPAVGSVAWFTYDHVAWVSNLNSDGTVQIEEYNNPPGSGTYNTRSITASSAWYIHFTADISSTATSTASTTILSLKSTRSPNGAIETFAATNSRVTENWYYDGGTGPQTRAIIDQDNIVAIDKLNIDSNELLYTAVSDGVWESIWAADSGTVASSKRVTGLSGVRSVFAENTFDSNGYRIHHLYILASDGPYEAYWKDSDPNHTVTVSRLTQITGGLTMTHSIGPDGSEQLYVAVPTWVYEVSWFPGGTINVRTVINISQGNIQGVEKGANLPDGGQLLYTTTSTTVWQTYWNGSSGFSNGTIATNQTNAFQSLKVVTPDGVHHVYLATPDHVQEYWWLGASSGGGELIRISQANIAAIAQQLDGTTQLLLTAAGSNVWETWWDSSHAPTTPSSPLFTVAK